MRAALLWVLWPLAAAGAPGYEEALVAWGLERCGCQVEPAPEGKRLEAVHVAAEEVVAPSDPYPLLLNLLHVRTHEEVIRREVLMEPGTPYVQELASESARNLRRMGIFSVVRVVAVRGRTPDSVGLLVVTKDLWSLRLNQDFDAVGALLQRLRLQATEQNFLGWDKRLAVDMLLRLDTLSLGQSWFDRRVAGSRWSLSESVALVLGRESGQPEGSRGSVALTRPLFSLDTRWAFQAQGSWRVQRSRVFRGADIWALPYPEGGTVPYVYDTRELAASALYLYSLGVESKLDLSGSVGVYERSYEPPGELGLEQPQRSWLVEQWLPRSERASYASLSVRAWRARFEVMKDVDSYALSEDFQTGHSVSATVRYAPPVLGGGAHFAELGVVARYRLRLGESMTTLGGAASVRRVLGGSQAGTWTGRRWAVELEHVSPRVLGGRVVARGLWDVNVDDIRERVLLLGGGNGLRGALPDAYSGKRMALLNLEWRSPPLVVHTVHLGAVLFYDAGSAFDEQPRPVHSVGVGLRLLFPQFNLLPFRFDFGYVINDERPPVGGRFSFSGGQVTEYRPAFLDSPLP